MHSRQNEWSHNSGEPISPFIKLRHIAQVSLWLSLSGSLSESTITLDGPPPFLTSDGVDLALHSLSSSLPLSVVVVSSSSSSLSSIYKSRSKLL